MLALFNLIASIDQAHYDARKGAPKKPLLGRSGR